MKNSLCIQLTYRIGHLYGKDTQTIYNTETNSIVTMMMKKLFYAYYSVGLSGVSTIPCNTKTIRLLPELVSLQQPSSHQTSTDLIFVTLREQAY
jgi:hypothetical protein